MDRDEASVPLITTTNRQPGIGSAFFHVRDVDALYAELLEKGADGQHEPTSRP